jgi:phosphoglycolate phosphatase-like HAD superfamily hydrolase
VSVARPIAAVDLDGVVADVRHRLHHLERRPKDWKAFFRAADSDGAHEEGLAIVAKLAEEHDIVFLTGRPQHLEQATRAWLARYALGDHDLVMRPEGDRRPAAQIKPGLLRQYAGAREVGMVVDDDPEVIAALRAAGFPTFLATWERRSIDEQSTLHQAQEHDGRT